MCDTCSKLQKELYESRLTIARLEGAIGILKATCGISSEKISFSFLEQVCASRFTSDVLKGGPRTYAAYITDHVMPGRVVLNKKNVRYVADDGNVVDESTTDFVAKILASTRVKANAIYDSIRDSCIGDFCKDSDGASSPTELAKTFANMAMVRNCNAEFCREVASIVIKNG